LEAHRLPAPFFIEQEERTLSTDTGIFCVQFGKEIPVSFAVSIRPSCSMTFFDHCIGKSQ